MRLKTTNCLFYKKFPYKIVIYGDWTPAGQYLTEEILDQILSGKKSFGYLEKIAKRNPKESRKIIQFVKSLDKEESKVRVEGRSMSIFLKDKALLEKIKKEFKDDIQAIYEPKDTSVLELLTSDKKIEIRKKLTHGCRYKVTLRSFDETTVSVRESFLNFAEKNPDQFCLTNLTKITLHRAKFSGWSTCYFYVKDEKFLLMAQMMIQPIIKCVYEIVTESEVEKGKNHEHA